MATKHVVLGLLIERSGYGYELQQRIHTRFGFLGFSETVIYGALDRLEDDGFIRKVTDRPQGRTRRGADRVRYAPTDMGLAEHRRWMASPSPLPVLRDELQQKLALSTRADLGQVIENVKEQEQECIAKLRALARPSPAELYDEEVSWEALAPLLIADSEVRRLQAQVEWLQDIRAVARSRLAQTVERDEPRLDEAG